MKDYHFKALGIGEILWDLLPDGKQLGGAPTNFSFHTNQFGMEAGIISSVGEDDLGKEIMHKIDSTSLHNFLTEISKPTGTVSVELAGQGIPSYIIHENVAWDYIKVSNEALQFAETVDVICFGSLAQRNDASRNAIYHVLEKVPSHAIKVFDINMRQNFYSKPIIEKSLEQANVLKINDEEILVFAEMFGLTGDEFSIIHQIYSNYKLDYLALTKGKDGSWLINKTGHSFLKTPEINVVDTVGAGDSFTASMVAGILHKKTLVEIHQLAVDVSAFVCTQEGATPALPVTLLNRL